MVVNEWFSSQRWDFWSCVEGETERKEWRLHCKELLAVVNVVVAVDVREFRLVMRNPSTLGSCRLGAEERCLTRTSREFSAIFLCIESRMFVSSSSRRFQKLAVF